MKKKVTKSFALLLAFVLILTSFDTFTVSAQALDQSDIVTEEITSSENTEKTLDEDTEETLDENTEKTLGEDTEQTLDENTEETLKENTQGMVEKTIDCDGSMSFQEAIVDKKAVTAADGRTIYISKQNYVYSENETKIYDFLIDKCGFNTAAACAVLGNMFMESMLDPECYGASENAWGLCQWERERLTQLQQRYPKNWKTLEGQLNYLLDEFHSQALDPWGPQTYEYLLKLPDTLQGARDGALYFAKWFERCWSGSYEKRQNFAEEFYIEWITAVSMPSIVKIAPSTEDSITCVWKRPANASRTALQIFDEDGVKLKGKTTELETYTFTGLKMFKTYKVRMWSISSTGKYSDRIDTMVKMENIPNKIVASSVTKTSISINRLFSIDASANDNAKLSYESSNSSVKVKADGLVIIKPKFVGEAKITITSAKTKKYAESKKTIKIKIVPQKPESLKAKSVPISVIQASWTQSQEVSGYQLQWSTDKTFSSGVKSEKVSGKTFSHILYGVHKNKTYYVRVRGYKTVNGTNYCSAWTSAVKVKVTK